MTKKTLQASKTVTRAFLVKQFSSFGRQLDARFEGVDNRLDQKLDIQTESLKGYIDSCISQVQAQMGRRFDTVEKKLSVNTAGLAKLIETRVGEILKIQEQVGEHGRRISVLEADA